MVRQITQTLEIDDLLNEHFFEKIKEVTKVADADFCEITNLLKLDPAQDFIESDLRDVCFDNCDLSGFNFKNADLSNTYGRNVTIDATTNLDGSNTECSIFAEEQKRRIFFKQPSWLDLYNRKMKDHWTDQSNWVFKNIEYNATHRHSTIAIAKEIFFNTSDSVVRS